MGKTAFDATRASIFYLNPTDIQIVGLDTTDGPEHPLYDQRIHIPLREETVLDIMQRGVIEPITVRKNGDVAQVVDGRRRVMHAREANRRLRLAGTPTVLVPVLPPKKGTEASLTELMIVLNAHREQDDTAGEALKMQAFLNRGYTVEQVAQMFGRSEQHIKNTLSLLDLAPQASAALAAKTITKSEAYALARKPREEQVRELRDRPKRVSRKGGRPNRAAVKKRLEEWQESKGPYATAVRDALNWVLTGKWEGR